MSSLKAAARAWVGNVAVAHLGKNIRGNFNFASWVGEANESGFGFIVDLQPIEGKLVEYGEEFALIKISAKRFFCICRDLMDNEPPVGAKVCVTTYARRDFDGARLDATKTEERTGIGGDKYSVRIIPLGGNNLKLPVQAVVCPYLADMIEQLETFKAGDGIRRIANVLVDANAKNFSMVDPTDEMIMDTRPEVACDFSTEKTFGRLAIVYNRVPDTYTIELRGSDGAVIYSVEDVMIDTLAQVIVDLIDDGSWKVAKVVDLSTQKRKAA